jgi:hypothetical protein
MDKATHIYIKRVSLRSKEKLPPFLQEWAIIIHLKIVYVKEFLLLFFSTDDDEQNNFSLSSQRSIKNAVTIYILLKVQQG